MSGILLKTLHPYGLSHQSERPHGWERQVPTDGDQNLSSTHHPLKESPPWPLLVSCIIQSLESPHSGPDGVLHTVWECLQVEQTRNKKRNDFEHTYSVQMSQVLWQRGAECSLREGRRGLSVRGEDDGCIFNACGLGFLYSFTPPECIFVVYQKGSFYPSF